MRKPLIRSWTTATSTSELKSQSHFFPYATLPIIHSHIQPHFVVYNLGTKLLGHDWLHHLFENRYKPLMSQHPTFITCVRLSMDIYAEWTRGQPPSGFRETYRSGDQMETGVDSSINFEDTYSLNVVKRSTRGGQSAGESGGAGGMDTANDDVEIYPNDSLTLVFEAAAEQEDANEPTDDEHTDDESDESFYARLSTWVTSVQPGPPPSPTAIPAHSLPGLKTPKLNKSDSDSDGSVTFVDSQTGLEFSAELGEKIGILSPFSFITPSPI